jgi:hypothetical protein
MKYIDGIQKEVFVELLPPPNKNVGIDTEGHIRPVRTVQIGDRLILANGQDPLRYVDLTKNKVVQYKEPTFITRVIARFR